MNVVNVFNVDNGGNVVNVVNVFNLVNGGGVKKGQKKSHRGCGGFQRPIKDLNLGPTD